MNTRLFLILLAIASNNSFANATAAKTTCNTLQSAQLLLGKWQSSSKKVQINEDWQRIDAQHFKGTGVTKQLNQDKPPFVESLEIVEMSGGVFYWAKTPQNALPVAFKLVACSDQYLKFENAKHDFPQVIEYQQTSKANSAEQTITATVSAKNNPGFQIHYTKKPSKNRDNIATVKNYVEAYNLRDLQAMMKHTVENIHWGIVDGDKVMIETKDRKSLTKALKQHFSRARKSHSNLIGISQYGNFVSAIEQVTSTKDGQPRSQCSLSVYQFDERLIEFVWYYPAGDC